MQQKTYYPKAAEIQRDWVVLDAEGQNLGRFAARIAHLLLGKHKPTFTPGVEMGDFVVVVNAEGYRDRYKNQQQARQQDLLQSLWLSGRLEEYFLKDQLAQHPDRALRDAVWGMLPHNRMGRSTLKRLKIYAGPNHPHQVQTPKVSE